PLRTIIRRPANIFTDHKPLDWSYRDIQRIDPVDWRPVQHGSTAAELWDTDRFISDACTESDAIRIGHYFFAGNRNHYKVFFLTQNIVSKYLDDICSRLEQQIREVLSKRERGVVTDIVYPSDSAGMKPIVERLAVEFGGVVPRGINRRGNPRTH